MLEGSNENGAGDVGSSGTTLIVGSQGGAGLWPLGGRLDELVIWMRALDPEEIAELAE